MVEKNINMIEPVDKPNNEPHTNDEVVYRKCKSCGCLFPLTISKLDYFRNKYGTVPCRCKNCRQRYTEKTEKGNKEN